MDCPVDASSESRTTSPPSAQPPKSSSPSDPDSWTRPAPVKKSAFHTAWSAYLPESPIASARSPSHKLHPPLKTVQPRLKQGSQVFFNTSGHQTTASSLFGTSTRWRNLKNAKLAEQFGKQASNGPRHESAAFRAKNRLDGDKSQPKISDALAGRIVKPHPPPELSKFKNSDSTPLSGDRPNHEEPKECDPSASSPPSLNTDDSHNATDSPHTTETTAPQIFRNLCFYVNGSTHPIISDIKLKHLLAEHGASVSISLSRRRVTHVIVSLAVDKFPNSANDRSVRCGGSLAYTKMNKEFGHRSSSAIPIQYVTVEWALDSIKAGRRLPESKYSGLSDVAKRMGGVRRYFETSIKPNDSK